MASAKAARLGSCLSGLSPPRYALSSTRIPSSIRRHPYHHQFSSFSATLYKADYSSAADQFENRFSSAIQESSSEDLDDETYSTSEPRNWQTVSDDDFIPSSEYYDTQAWSNSGRKKSWRKYKLVRDDHEGLNVEQWKYQRNVEGRLASLLLTHLREAIQRQDRPSICAYFLQWTSQLSKHIKHFDYSTSTIYRHPAVTDAATLPKLVFSEILRNLDPILYPTNDVAHDLCLDQDLITHTGAFSAVDVKTGVHRHHLAIFEGMLTLMAIRPVHERPMLSTDYAVLLRCAGTILNPHVVDIIKHGSKEVKGLSQEQRSVVAPEHWKARYATEPLFYQNDKARVAWRQADRYSNQYSMEAHLDELQAWDSLRIETRTKQVLTWNEQPRLPGVDLRRIWRRRKGKWSFAKHIFGSVREGTEMTEDMVATALIGFARSQGVILIREWVFEKKYGIKINHLSIRGGFKFPPHHPLKPTTRLLEAIVEGLGSIAELQLAKAMLIYVSERYDIPIPPRLWSSLLSWAEVVNRPEFRAQRRLFAHRDNILGHPRAKPRDIIDIYDTMTRPPYSCTPTFDDNVIIASYFSSTLHFDAAALAIRVKLLPVCHAATAAHDAAIADETQQASVLGTATASAIRTRQRASLLKDSTHRRTARLVQEMIADCSRSPDPAISYTLIPSLLTEFGFLLDSGSTSYDAVHGHVTLHAAPGDRGAAGPYVNHVKQSLERVVAPVQVRNAFENRIWHEDIEEGYLDAWPKAPGGVVKEDITVPLPRMARGPVKIRDGIPWQKVWKNRLKVEMMR